MKTILLLAFTFFLAPAFSQQMDSLAVVQRVDSLMKETYTFIRGKDYDKAMEINAAAQKLVLEKLGRESKAYVSTCTHQGRLLLLKGDTTEAEKWYLESLSITEKLVGKAHQDYTISLSLASHFYSQTGNTEKAESLLIEARTIAEKAYGKNSPRYASATLYLAKFHTSLNRYSKAEPLFIESLQILESGFMDSLPSLYMDCLHTYAIVSSITADYEKSVAVHLKYKDFYEKTYGKETARYANILNNLAADYGDMRAGDKMEPLLLEAKAIYEKTLGKEHEKYAETINNLGYWSEMIGDYAKAEIQYLESAEIYKKKSGENDYKYAFELNNLANLYKLQRFYDKSEALILQCKIIFEKTIGKDDPDYADCLSSLGDIYYLKGAYAQAESHLNEALTIMENVLGKAHPKYAIILSQLAKLYSATEDYPKAERLFREAIAIAENVLGKESDSYIQYTNELAVLYWKTGKTAVAERLFEEITALETKQLMNSAAYLSEREMQFKLRKFEPRPDQNFSFLQHASTPAFSGSNFDNTLFYKGMLLQNSKQVRSRIEADSALAELFSRFKSCHRRLAAQYALPYSERDSAGIAELEEKANTLEKELVRSVAGFGDALRLVRWQELQSTLRPNEVALEFVRYNFVKPAFTDSTMYAAFLLRPGDVHPHFIPLFEEKSLDSLLYTSGERRADYVNHLYTLADRGARPLGKPQKSLYDLLWKPLEPHLSGVKTIYYAPSGLLHRLNLAAIPINLDSVLGDQYNLVELGSTRQLVVPTTIKPAANDAVLFGGISYDADSTANITSGAISSSRGELSFAYTDSTLRVGAWTELPYTGREVASVEKTMQSAGLQTDTYLGYAATEEAFKNIGNSHGVTSSHPVTGSPRVLHIATHGYFFPDPETSARFQTSPTLGAAEPVFKLSDHPMIRSGLILAGGNHAWATGKSIKPDMEDGILTAYEISQMNLSNTELVVLSACETGLGDIQGNEGVYGLQRAFKIAGVRYLIMSLWQVPDKQTSLLMTTFYKKWLEEKMEIPEAFRAAQKELREAGLDPYQWAGFVLVE